MRHLEQQFSILDKLSIESFGVSAYGPAISMEVYEGDMGKGLFLSGAWRISEIVKTLWDFNADSPGHILWRKFISLLAVRSYVRTLKRVAYKTTCDPDADSMCRKINEVAADLFEEPLASLQGQLWQLLPAEFRALARQTGVNLREVHRTLEAADLQHLRHVFAPFFVLGEVDNRFRQALKYALLPVLSSNAPARQLSLYVDPPSAIQLGAEKGYLDELGAELEEWLVNTPLRFERESIVSFLLLAACRSEQVCTLHICCHS